MNIDTFFLNAWVEICKNPDLKNLLEQKSIDEEKPIFDLMKKNLLRHTEIDPDNWNDPGFHYGHIGILVNEENRKFATKSFFVPVLNLMVDMGRIVDINGKDGIRLVWKKHDL